MGGYVAFEFVQLFPARVVGLVLAGTRAPADNEQEKAGREQQVQTMLRAGMVPISIATLPKLLAARTLAEKPDVVKRVRHDHEFRSKGAAAANVGWRPDRLFRGPAKIDVPLLVIVGREDSIRPTADAESCIEAYATRVGNYRDAAHMTNMEQPEVFDDALLRFLTD